MLSPTPICTQYETICDPAYTDPNVGGCRPKKVCITPTPNQTVCTQDAKLCPDGKTYVGRTGPNCEFAACPK